MTTDRHRPSASTLEGVLSIEGPHYLVEPVTKAMHQTTGGIWLPEQGEKKGFEGKEEKARFGRVVAYGDGWYDGNGVYHACKYDLGDLLYVSRHTKSVTILGHVLRQVPESAVICKIDPDVVQFEEARKGLKEHRSL